MSRRNSGTRQNTGDPINNIPALARGDLMARWETCYGTLPHKLISTRLLVMAVAYAVQVEQHGGLAKRTRKELLRLAEATGASTEVKSSNGHRSPATMKTRSSFKARPRSGTRFVREWNGKSHIVEVVETGFAWQGKTYRSLSAIAMSITGTRWSGPRFFGLAS